MNDKTKSKKNEPDKISSSLLSQLITNWSKLLSAVSIWKPFLLIEYYLFICSISKINVS